MATTKNETATDPTVVSHKQTRAGWLGAEGKAKLNLDPAQTYCRIEYENSGLTKSEIETMINDGLTLEVKKYQGPISLFKPTGIAHADAFKAVLSGERVKA